MAVLVTGAVAGAQVSPAPASSSLISLDRPTTLGIANGEARLDARFFGGDEDAAYGNLSVLLGLQRGFQIGARGTIGRRMSRGLSGGGRLRYGGGDLEILGRYQWEPGPGRPFALAGIVGVAFPDTPAQGGAHLTLGASADVPIGPGISVVVNPRAVLIESNTIVGLGLGVTAAVAPRLTLMAEITPILAGENTRDVRNGGRRRRSPYGIGVRYRLDERLALEAGLTNTLGATTGFALTPTLGGKNPGLYLAVSGRFGR